MTRALLIGVLIVAGCTHVPREHDIPFIADTDGYVSCAVDVEMRVQVCLSEREVRP